jgi:hypothetical protein
MFARAWNWGSVPTKATALYLTAQKGQHETVAWWLDENPYTTPADIRPTTGSECEDAQEGNHGWIWDDTTNLWCVQQSSPFGWFVDVDGGGWGGDDQTEASGLPDFIVYNQSEFAGVYLNVIPGQFEGQFFFDDPDDPDGEYDLYMNIDPGVRCDGTVQVDPGGPGVPTGGYLHVEQGADQNSQYIITLQQEWTNWNEWGPELCFFNDIPIPPNPAAD